jgi:hypothetical protein
VATVLEDKSSAAPSCLAERSTTLLRAMSAFDELPPDQRAVVELVLRSGRSYDQIAGILRIDRAAVRARALAALDELAAQDGTDLPEARRALITDYLLGQLPPRLADQVRARLGEEGAERSWAEAVAAQLRAVSAAPLPEIPAGVDGSGPRSGAAAESGEPPTDARQIPAPRHHEARPAPPRVPVQGQRPSSRLGGAILLGVGALVVIAAIVLVLVLSSGGGGGNSGVQHQSTAAGTSVPLATTSATTSGTPGKPKGAAEVISEKGKLWLFVVAVNLPANSHNYYAVWLTNGPTDSVLIGYAQPVGSNGRLAAFAPGVQLSYARFKQMVVTLEATLHPKTPGTVVLSGPFSLNPAAPKSKPLALTILNQPSP